MLRFATVLCLSLCLASWFVSAALATSGQSGDTGLLSQPTAQTLNEGNICVGIWANCAGANDSNPTLKGESSLIVPATITMGLGTFMEAYGSYPNLLFNGDEDASGRGYANAGFKFRVFGKRADNFRLGVDVQGRRSISDDPEFDGLTDYLGRLIASLQLGNTFGLHVNAGYASNDSPENLEYDDQILLGGGIEYSLATRLRLVAEFSHESEKIPGLGEPSEVTAGFQYFITPHLTMNLGGSVGLSDASPEWRVLMGLTTCQGVGTYNRPVPKLVDPDAVYEEPVEPVKISKIRSLTPLISRIAVAESPISHLEVPLKKLDETMMVDPSDRLQAPDIKPFEVSPLGAIGVVRQAGQTGLPAQPFPAKVQRRFRFPELTFSLNQWDLSAEGRESISLVAEEIRRENKYFIISIEGHTDDVGSESYNRNLSFKRAVATATHMVLRDGFDPARIFVKGYGESRPIDNNASDAGRARNRRVELLLLVPEGYEDIRIDSPSSDIRRNDGNVLLQRGAVIDPLAIEEAIIEKTGAETARPAGTFSQVEKKVQE